MKTESEEHEPWIETPVREVKDAVQRGIAKWGESYGNVHLSLTDLLTDIMAEVERLTYE